MIKLLKLKKTEFKLLILLSLIIILITSAPYAYVFFNTPSNYQYLGMHLAPSDIFVYESYINNVKSGNFLIDNLFHNEIPPEKNFNIFWLLAGLFAKIFHLTALLSLHLLRIILIPICLFSIYKLISFFLEKEIERKVAIILIAFSSGLGAMLAPFIQSIRYIDEKIGYYNWPLDIWAAESNTFLTFYQSPHFIASLTFLVLIFYFFLKALSENRKKYSVIAGILGLIYFNFHPYYLITILSVFSTYLIITLIQRQKTYFINGIKHAVIIGIISAPPIIFHAYNILNNPLAKQKAEQNLCKTTAIPLTIISYGIPLLIAIYGIYYLIHKKKIFSLKQNAYIFLVVWLVVNFIIIYLPFLKFQRRLTEGMQIPIVILATIGIFAIYEKIKNKDFLVKTKKDKELSFVYILTILVILSLSNIYIIISGFLMANEKISYIEKEKIESMAWIQNNIKNNETIIAGSLMGNIIPAYSNKTVFFGHWVETFNYKEKQELAVWFFKNNYEDLEKQLFLKKYRINYIFFSDMEDMIGDFIPDEKKYLQKVYENYKDAKTENQIIKIYKVVN